MKQLLVFGEKTFRINVPDNAKITFGPFSPPVKNHGGFRDGRYDPTGTLRIYQGTKENIVACFAGVTGFRDLSLGYAEQVAKEEGATLWKDDEQGYVRENRVSVQKHWVDPQLPQPKTKRRKK